MIKKRLFIAVDLGGSHGRVFIGGIGKTVKLEHEFSSKFYPLDENGNFYWDIEYIYKNILQSIISIYEKYRSYQIVSIGVDCFGNHFGLLDANDALCGPVFHGKSTQTLAVQDIVASLMGGYRNLYNLTGIANTYYDMINQLYAAKLYMKEDFKKVRNILLLPDLIGFWLTGVKHTEKTAISVTQIYNPKKNDYENSILSMLGLSKESFPIITETGSYRGKVQLDYYFKQRDENRLSFINVAEHDTASSVSTIISDENCMFISSGTMSVIGCIIDQPLLTDETFNLGFSNESAISGKIRLVKNILGMYIVNECKKCWGVEGQNFSLLDEETIEERSFPSAIDPSDKMFITPNSLENPMVERICAWCKLNNQLVPSNRGQILITIYKGLALKYQETLRDIEKLTRKKINKIHIVGGGSKNWILNQLTADYCEIVVNTGPIEASATGNIIVQMKAAGDIKTHAEGLDILINRNELRHFYPSK
nr:FGGY-family carbohydrate kinase [uncultured Sphaerochaeta sp.]